MFFFVCFVFWFLRIIKESAGERGLLFSGLTIEIPELRHWHYSDLYFVKYGHVILRLPSQSYYCFINTVCALWLSDVAIIESLLSSLSRWQSFLSTQEHFLNQGTSWQPHRQWSNKNLNLKTNHTDKRLVFEMIYIYRCYKCHLIFNFICIFCVSLKFFYYKDSISILFYIYYRHKSSFIRVSITKNAN